MDKKFIKNTNMENLRKKDKIVAYLKNKTDLIDITFKDISTDEDNVFFLDYSRRVLYLINREYLNSWLFKKYLHNNNDFVHLKNFNFVISRPFFKSESAGIFGIFTSLYSSLKNLTLLSIKTYQNLNNPQVVAWAIDLLTVVLELNDPFFWRPISLLKFLARVYTICLRYSHFKEVAVSQSLDDTNIFDTLILTIACFGVPDALMNKIKLLSHFTSKKLLDSPNIILDMIGKFLEVFKDSLEYISKLCTFGGLDFISKIIDVISIPLNFINGMSQIKSMTHLVMKFNKNSQVIFDPEYRHLVLELFNVLKINTYFQSLLANPSYRAILIQYNLFKEIHKMSVNFSSSSRIEPVCIVFEGKAGCGKTTFMNKLIDYFVKNQYSVYNHTCPSIDAGKDFYDDYMNQDVFVMDDVGQQGVSQWRQIINFVSTTKYPLDCAVAENKNTKFFNSKIILITTNHFSNLRGFTKEDCISEVPALFRRCHVFNFDKVIKNDTFRGEINYKKFDYQNNKWKNEFIFPWNAIKLPVNHDVTNLNKCIAWIYFLTRKFYETNEDLFNLNELNIQDEAEIDDFVKFFEDINEKTFEDHEEYYAVESFQIKKNSNNAKISQGFSDFFHYSGHCLDIFKEYFNGFFNTCLSGIATSIVGITSITGISPSSIVSVLIGVFSHFLAYFICKKLFDIIFGSKEFFDDLNERSFNKDVVAQWRKEKTGANQIINTYFPLENFLFGSEGVSTLIENSKNRMRVIELVSEDGHKNICQCIVSGRRLVVQCHSYTSNKGIANIYKDWICFENRVLECNNIPFEVVKEFPQYDISVIELRCAVPMYKDVSSILFPNNYDKNLSRRRLYLVNSEFYLNIENNFNLNPESFVIQNVVNKPVSVAPYTGIYYNNYSASGLCGTLVMDNDLGLTGMHIAGDGGRGFAIIFPKDFLIELKNLLSFSNSIHLECINQSSKSNSFSGMRFFNEEISSKVAIDESSLKPTEMFEGLTEKAQELGEKFPPNFKIFGNKTIERMAEKSFSPIPLIPHDEIEFGKKCIRTFFKEFDDLSDFEVIKGNKDKGLSTLNKDSVNGLGYSNLKEDYLNMQTGEITDKFKEILENFINNCNNDTVKVEDLLFYEAMKDELRLFEKKDKPRSFRIGPLHHTFLVKKFLGNLFAHCKTNMWENQMAIGMNPYKDWNKLYKKLLTNYLLFDGDVGNYDGSNPVQVADAISDLFLEFYKGEHPKVFKVLLDSICRTFVLIKEKIFLTTHSIPSGVWITAFINSLVNRFITAMVIYREMKKLGKVATVADFNKVTDFVLGDDKICGSPEDMKDIFNALTVKSFFNSIGMKYTDAEKGEIITPSKPIHELNFLKRGFRWHTKMKKIVGPLSLNTLVNSLRYSNSKKNYSDIMNGKMTAFQFEIFLHEDLILKKNVLKQANECSFYFQEFSDEHIMVTMEDDETYSNIMQSLGKDNKNFL